MYRFKTIALIALATGLSSPGLFSADATPPAPAPAASTTTNQPAETGTSPAHRGRHERRSELKKLIKDLNLTADQQTQIKALLKARRSAIEALPKEERRGPRANEIRETYRGQIRAVLTPEQQAKFDARKHEREAEHEAESH